MYSQPFIERRLALAEQQLGFRLQHHTVSEVESFESHLRASNRYLYDDYGNPIGVQNLSTEEKLWMLNERALVKCDAAYALTRYCYVKSEEGFIDRFRFRLAQTILFDLIAVMEAQGISIEVMILKARQLGMTTLVQLLIMLRIVFGYGVNAVAASAEVEKSKLMANKLFMAYKMLPVWLRPQHTAMATEGDQPKLVFGHLNTMFSVQHGNKLRGGIAQGWTPTIYHISEVALFPNPQMHIDEGLWKAVHASPSVFGILESTGAGDTDWWAGTWRYSKSNWPNCRVNPLFLPWFCGIEIYPMPADLKKAPVPDDWHPLPDTLEHVAKCEAYVAHHDILRKRLGARWHMPPEQQWYWELGHEEAKSKGNESSWYQSMAGDDIEALQRSIESYFEHDIMVNVDQSRDRSYDLYGIVGQSIESNHHPSTNDVDYTKQRIPVIYRSRKGINYSWELIPLLFDPDQIARWRLHNPDAFKSFISGKLIVFHPPAPGTDYSCGVDTSNGIGGDSTVISLCSIGHGSLPDIQAAEFRSPFVNHVEAYAFTMAINAFYSRHMSEMQHQEPLVAVEQLRSVGDVCQLQMRKMGYSRFFRFIRYDKANISKIDSNQLGWMTTGWSRPMLIGGFKHSLANGWYKLNSPWTIHECEHFEAHLTATGRPRPEHAEDEHDDGIFASAISTFIAHDLDSLAERTRNQFMRPDQSSLPPLDTRPSAISMRSLPENLSLTDLSML